MACTCGRERLQKAHRNSMVAPLVVQPHTSLSTRVFTMAATAFHVPGHFGHGDDLLFQRSLRACFAMGLLLTAGTGLRAQGASPAPFDLTGPRIDMRVTRGNKTLPIAAVPNLQPGDKVWVHPELPPSQ